MAAEGRALRLFKTWFWRPPRPHGETIADRRVSPLELLYDLVYAAVLAQAGHHLAAHMSVAGFVEFGAVFSLTWFAWTNGSLYLELHGRSDGRTRTFVFLQIAILAVLAVYAADASGDSGFGFAIAYAVFLAVMTWLWYDVRRQDVVDRPEFLLDTGRYVIAMSASVLLILISAFVPTSVRLSIWSLFTLGWIVLFSLLGRSPVGLGRGMAPTDSLVERFGTFTIIVLGEVVFSVVEGITRSERDATSIATGMVALVVSFGFWWIYFDVIGGRLPKAMAALWPTGSSATIRSPSRSRQRVRGWSAWWSTLTTQPHRRQFPGSCRGRWRWGPWPSFRHHALWRTHPDSLPRTGHSGWQWRRARS